MNVLFLMDPLETVIVDKDTTFMLMVGANQRGHNVFYLPEGGITRRDGKSFFHVREVVPQISQTTPFLIQQKQTLSEDQVDVIFIRPNPPFDQDYLLNTWLLDLLPSRIVIVNNPTGIRTVNEKIWATQFTNIIPPTMVTRSITDMLSFLRDEKDIVVKPTDGFGGQSVFHVRQAERNTRVIFETLSAHGKREIILQRYIPEATHGDKRILLLNGEPLGAVLRLHSDEDHRNNFFAGGKPKPAEITARDLEIIKILKPHLKALGLYFVGIDIMGGYLVEVNVTSPTCLQEMNRLYNLQLEQQVIDFVEYSCPN